MPIAPPYLREIADAPPPMLCVLGRVELLGSDAVAIVGARNASVHGGRFAQCFAAEQGHGEVMVAPGFPTTDPRSGGTNALIRTARP